MTLKSLLMADKIRLLHLNFTILSFSDTMYEY